MMASFLASVVDFCRRFAVLTVVFAAVASVGLGVYVVRNISINTDINQLLSEELDWRKREKALEAAFPHKTDTTVIVIDAASARKADEAAAALAEKLSALPEMFTFVSRPDALPFFRDGGLLFLSKGDLAATLDRVVQAQPMLGAIVSDPSLRGFLGLIDAMAQGIQGGAMDSAQIERPLKEIGETIRAGAEGKDRALNWRNLMPAGDDPIASRELRRYVVVKPALDYSALQPGAATTLAIRSAVEELNLTPDAGVRVRLTGSVPLNDDEFASVSEGAGVSTTLCGLLVVILSFMALRTWRIVVPIAATLVVGLIASTAFATVAVGSLNLISVAFAVMFLGIAVDFGIQFGVRYRDERSREPDYAEALRRTARVVATPLAMAAGATALGFLAFTPTDYRGVSELGLIAGVGMLIAFVLNITLLPALMTLTKPPAESEKIGIAALASVNAFLIEKRNAILPAVLVLTVGGLAAAAFVRFDFDPLNLKNPKDESVSTMLELIQDPDSDAYAAQLLAPSKEEALRIAAELEGVPEVDHAMTIESFVPEEQGKKIAMIADTAALLAPTFALSSRSNATDEENVSALRATAQSLELLSEGGPAAKELAEALRRLSEDASPELRERVQKNLVMPMQEKVGEIRKLLKPKKVSHSDIPQELKRDWISKDGQYLVEIFPKRIEKNDPRNPAMLVKFIDAVQGVAPEVSGTPVSIRESGRAIVSAFVHAGIYGFVSIVLLSFVALRRVRDVALMVLPLATAGVLTLATMASMGMPLNFANIIALPLLFSLGVSYAVYFVFFARQGRRDFLQSSMARAVLFSAATALVAFMSLSFSSHLGTRGMGEILTISLVYSLSCTFFVLPVLYGFARSDMDAVIRKNTH